MFNWSRRLIGLFSLLLVQVNFLELMANPKNINFYGILLRNIYSEQPFHTMLFVQHENAVDSSLEVFHQYPVPKIVLTQDIGISMKAMFNAEILALVMIENNLDEDLMLILAKTLDCVRQTRILTVVLNAENKEKFKLQMAKLCETYKMTNVHLHFIFDSSISKSSEYYQLFPYPEYTWASISMENLHEKLFPQHWHNFQNKTLATFADLTQGKSLLYEDSHGNLKLTGMLAELILLFGNYYNAFLQMYRPLVKGNVGRYEELFELTKAGLLDVPMAMKPSGTSPAFDISDTFLFGKGQLMVPCALPLTPREIYKVILEFNFFSCVIVCSIILSIAHTVIDIIYLNRKHLWNFVLNAHVLPGILGLSFAVRESSLKGFRVIYFLVGFAGIYMASLFSGKLSTLLTAPPFHKQISTFDDIKRSPLKILLIRAEVELLFKDLLDSIKDSIVMDTNPKYVLGQREAFNTSYGYYVYSQMWEYFTYRQQFFAQKIFCSSSSLVFIDIFSFGMVLQHNSPYKEALNYLLHRVHASGLNHAWQANGMPLLLRVNNMSLGDSHPREDHRILNSWDLIWVWWILGGGLVVSCVAFAMEMYAGQIYITKKIFEHKKVWSRSKPSQENFQINESYL